MFDNESQALITQVLSSYLSNNTVSSADLPPVIVTVKKAFNGENLSSSDGASGATKAYEPAVPVKNPWRLTPLPVCAAGVNSNHSNGILQAENQMNPGEYRAAFNLKADYPIVAPNYAAQRSALAKSLGLGRKPDKAAYERRKRTSAERRQKRRQHDSPNMVGHLGFAVNFRQQMQVWRTGTGRQRERTPLSGVYLL